MDLANEGDKVIALAGNPNVGKSTVFNNLTGLKQHTGNWPGKTVSSARGYCRHNDRNYVLVDIPGTYSLMAHSVEEEVARDFICFGGAGAVIVVCDATCLERNLNLVLQTIEITDKVVVCVNLLDEAQRKNVRVDLDKLSELTGVPVVGTKARKGEGLGELMLRVEEMTNGGKSPTPVKVTYNEHIEEAVDSIEKVIKEKVGDSINTRWLSLRLLNNEPSLLATLNHFLGFNLLEDDLVYETVNEAVRGLEAAGYDKEALDESIASSLVLKAEEISGEAVSYDKRTYNRFDRKMDKYLTNKWTGFPTMILLLLIIFWITITGANYPSSLLADGLFWIQDRLVEFSIWAGIPEIIYQALIYGVYRVLAWVVSVMLPPMAIFFPLFTLLEDLGYLPRIAFNLDKYFKKCSACGKQALTMCMGFGCNAAGVTGCRIIDSPRERLIAILTNNFVPCNGRFPALISIITMFFVAYAVGPLQSILSALALTAIIVLGVMMTFFASKLLSKTILKGIPSSFTLELPPYRRPQIGKVIVRSIFDRTLFVLGRAVVVAAPAGLVIWLLANIFVGDISLLAHCSGFLDPFAKLMGLDGVILLAFILGFPANEIVVPIIIMCYMATGSILEFDSLSQLKQLLQDNGWTFITATSTILFSLLHWPCSTTCLTIKKETRSIKWMLVSIALPTVIGIIACIIFANTARFILWLDIA